MYKLILTSNEMVKGCQGRLYNLTRAYNGLYATSIGNRGGFNTSEVMIDIEHDDIRFVVTHNNTYVFAKEGAK